VDLLCDPRLELLFALATGSLSRDRDLVPNSVFDLALPKPDYDPSGPQLPLGVVTLLAAGLLFLSRCDFSLFFLSISICFNPLLTN